VKLFFLFLTLGAVVLAQKVTVEFDRTVDLGGHLKTGHRRILQNRPTEQNQDKSSYTLMPAV